MQVLREDQLDIGGIRIAAAPGSLTLRTTDEDGGELRLDPDEVTQLLQFLRSIVISPNDRRGSYRIRIPTACGFEATILVEGARIACEARDLSFTGVRLQPALPDAPGLEIGSVVRVLLEFERQSVIADATVVRRMGSELGLSFVGSEEVGTVDPLPGLARLVRQIERYWVAENWKV